jgi:hypothetical protein
MTLNLKDLLEHLFQHDVEFVIVGGVAANALGSTLATFDLDICYARTPENLERLAAALTSLHATLRDAPAGLPFRPDAATLKAGLNFTFNTDLGPLDILGEIAGLGTYNQVAAAAEGLDLFGMPMQVLTLQGLIAAKRAAGRPKDQAQLLELEALQELRAELHNNTYSVDSA